MNEAYPCDALGGRPGGGRIPLVALGSAVRPHSEERSTLDHYGLLRTIEETLGLPLMRRAVHAEDLSSLLAPALALRAGSPPVKPLRVVESAGCRLGDREILSAAPGEGADPHDSKGV